MITLKINKEIVAEKAYAKYLGIIFDNKLTWHFHIEHIALKLTKSNGLIAKLRHFISLDKLKLIATMHLFKPTWIMDHFHGALPQIPN